MIEKNKPNEPELCISEPIYYTYYSKLTNIGTDKNLYSLCILYVFFILILFVKFDQIKLIEL